MTPEVWIAIITCFGSCFAAILVFIVQMRGLRNDSKKREESQEEQRKQELKKLEDNLTQVIFSHRDEYLKGIDKCAEKTGEVMSSVSDLKASYHNTISLIDLRLDTLSKNVEKHNNVIERTYKLEQDTAVQAAQIEAIQLTLADK